MLENNSLPVLNLSVSNWYMATLDFHSSTLLPAPEAPPHNIEKTRNREKIIILIVLSGTECQPAVDFLSLYGRYLFNLRKFPIAPAECTIA